MLKQKTVWFIFISLSFVLVACGQQEAMGKVQMYDADVIRQEIEGLNPDNKEEKEILYGKKLFDETNTVLPDNVGNELSCMDCHGRGGLEPDSPMVGVTNKYPKMNHGVHTTMKDRINGCFVRSMNGEELPEYSKELNAMEAYLEFLSKDVKSEEAITWRMTNNKEKVHEPSVSRGEELYSEKTCMACHATDGSGDYGPPLWGEGSFNEAAGMTRLSKATAFIQNNMPKGEPGTLTDQEAADIAAFLLSHERPIADPKKVDDYHLNPERDYITKERREKIRNGTFDWATLEPVIPDLEEY